MLGCTREDLSVLTYLMDISEEVGVCMCVHANTHACNIGKSPRAYSFAHSPPIQLSFATF